MADPRQLRMVLELRQKKEQDAADQLRQARHHLLTNQQQFEQLQQYRGQYWQALMERSNQGLGAGAFSQYQAFIARIDQSVVATQQAISVAEEVVAQREQLYLKARSECEAVQVLLDKAEQRLQQKQLRQEQQLSDEWALRATRR